MEDPLSKGAAHCKVTEFSVELVTTGAAGVAGTLA